MNVMRMSRLAGLGLAALALAGAGSADSTASTASALKRAALGPSMFVECDYHCDMCIQYGYTMNAPGTPKDHWGYGYFCAEAPCPEPCLLTSNDRPGSAPMDNRAIQRIQTLVAAGDATALEQTLSGDERIELNSARSAIQVMGCNTTVLAHIPVSAELMSQLAHH